MQVLSILNANGKPTAFNGIHTSMPKSTEFAEGVSFVTTLLSNVFLIDNDDGSWVLLDTGVPGFAARVRDAARERYGNQPPEAIILSHGHFDHVGNAEELADEWDDAPIYAHRLEMPYVTGKSSYPPGDAVAASGALGFMYRFFPTKPYDLTPRIQVLPEDGTVPGLPEWRAIHTPGHTPGHVAYFRERDGVLVAADALSTAAQDSPRKLLFAPRQFELPPAPFTTDWVAAHTSVLNLARLRPTTVAAGHGLPISGPDTAKRLEQFAGTFKPPKRGRYVRQPAIADETGVVYVPPPVPDFVPVAVGSFAVLAGVAGALWIRNRVKADREEEERTRRAA
jgi:glyoxylase-like metal-dependent hydrolase (beta-lactamase superfamily II)